MTTSTVRQPGEDIDSLIFRFRQKVNRDGVLREFRQRRYFISRNELRRRQAHKRELRRQKLWLRSESRRSQALGRQPSPGRRE
jgi:ribosomal protein S21